jgi:ubiquinone/menaquinone biosynthesis C-methylase UbiE
MGRSRVTMVDALDRALRPELMDAPGLSLEATQRALLDLERVNRRLLGLSASRRALLTRLAGGPRQQTILDVGTGSGQIPRSLARAATRRNVGLRFVGVDRKLSHLLLGRSEGGPAFRIVAAADALPLRDGAVHWSFSNLLFHHFGASDNRRILNEMRRVARRGALVVDLRRAGLARALVRILLPLLRVGTVARYDGYLSADQAWTLGEVLQLTAEMPVIELRRRFPFRFSLVLEP